MKGHVIVWPAPNVAELQEFDVLAPGPGEVLIENAYTLLSAGTEKAFFLDAPNTGGTFPHYPGYSGSGVIAAVGEGVTGVTIGDRVLADHAGHRSHSLKSASSLTVIRDGAVDMRAAATVVLAAMSLQGVRKTRLELGESVLVAGLGLLGIFAVQLARLAGGLPVIASDPDEARRTLALALGADYAFDPGEADFQAHVFDATRNRGVNAVVEVSGAAVALKQALGVTAPRGRVSLLGCTRVSDVAIDFYREVHKPGISLIGAHNFARPGEDSSPGFWTYRDDFETLLELLARKRLQVEPLLSATVSPAEAPRIYRQLAGESMPSLGILFDWQALS